MKDVANLDELLEDLFHVYTLEEMEAISRKYAAKCLMCDFTPPSTHQS